MLVGSSWKRFSSSSRYDTGCVGGGGACVGAAAAVDYAPGVRRQGAGELRAGTSYGIHPILRMGRTRHTHRHAQATTPTNPPLVASLKLSFSLLRATGFGASALPADCFRWRSRGLMGACCLPHSDTRHPMAPSMAPACCPLPNPRQGRQRVNCNWSQFFLHRYAMGSSLGRKVHACTHTYAHVCTHARARTRTHTHAHAHAHMRVHAHTRAHAHAHAHTHMHTHTHTHKHTHTRTQACTYACTHATHACTRTHARTRMHAHIYACRRARTRACTQT